MGQEIVSADGCGRKEVNLGNEVNYRDARETRTSYTESNRCRAEEGKGEYNKE